MYRLFGVSTLVMTIHHGIPPDFACTVYCVLICKALRTFNPKRDGGRFRRRSTAQSFVVGGMVAAHVK